MISGVKTSIKRYHAGSVAVHLSETAVVGYFEVPDKSTHTRNAITAVADTMTRNAKVPIAMPIQ